MVGWKKLSAYMALALLSLTSRVAADDVESSGPMKFLREKYDGLSPNGKFVAGAALGFVGSRLVLGSAVSALKVAGAAFIA
jgi:hypothetical protein